MDYKNNTPEGRSVQSKYGKILYASRPETAIIIPDADVQPKQTFPFAALRGYDDDCF